MKSKKPKAKAKQACRLVVCEDPVTGKVTIKSDGPCPPGHIEKVMLKAKNDGITFDLTSGDKK